MRRCPSGVGHVWAMASRPLRCSDCGAHLLPWWTRLHQRWLFWRYDRIELWLHPMYREHR